MGYTYGTLVNVTTDGHTRKWQTFIYSVVTETPTTYDITISSGIYMQGTAETSFKTNRVSGTASGVVSASTSNAGSHTFSKPSRYWTIFGAKKLSYKKDAADHTYSETVTIKAVKPSMWHGTSTAKLTFTVSKIGVSPNAEVKLERASAESSTINATLKLSATSQIPINAINVTETSGTDPASVSATWKRNGVNVEYPFDLSSEQELTASFTGATPFETKQYEISIESVVGTKVYEVVNSSYSSEWKPSASVTFECDRIPQIDKGGMADMRIQIMVDGEWVTLPSDSYSIRINAADSFSVSDIVIPKEYIGTEQLTKEVTMRAMYETVDTEETPQNVAIYSTTRNAIYSTGLANNIWLGGCTVNDYSSRVWYSYVNNPLYMPDDNYIEVGSNDKGVMGLAKVGDYLGIVKQGSTTDTSIYLAYPTSFENDTTFAIKQEVSGIGANTKHCFNVLNDETLFMSNEGIMAISPASNDGYKTQNRSFFINKPLIEEENIQDAHSFVYRNMYILAVDGTCYVLDGTQKNSWVNTKTNLQYEAYIWDNIPAKCFAERNGLLWFTDGQNLCRFKTDEDEEPYTDNGLPISAEWSTIMDDDSSIYYFKNLQKKGCVVSIMPMGGNTSAEVYIKKDEEPERYIGRIDADQPPYPVEFYVRKKIKKYKRLQFIVRNNEYNQGFGIDQIIKQYTIGNYSK